MTDPSRVPVPPVAGVLGQYSASGASLSSGADFPALDAAPLSESKASAVAGLLAARSHLAGATGWVVYTRDDSRQPWDQAVADSITAYTAKHGPPTLALMAARPHPAEALLARALTGAGLVLTRGGVTVQPGTWGLSHAE